MTHSFLRLYFKYHFWVLMKKVAFIFMFTFGWVFTPIVDVEIRCQNTINIPIVFHVIHNSADTNHEFETGVLSGKIYEQVDIINKAFNGRFQGDKTTKMSPTISVEQEHEFRFYIAGCESGGRMGIVRTNSQFTACQIPDITNPSFGGSTPWSIDSFINVYVGDFEACGLSGLSTQCDSLSEESSIIVIDYRFLGRNNMEGLDRGFTLVHELGHYLGLLHPWGNDFDGCISDDGIEDTPNQSRPYYGCPSFPQRSCGSTDYYFTFMDYVDDNCMELFTPGQINKMIATLESKYPFLLTNKVNCDIDYARYNFCDLVGLYPNPVFNGFLYINISENLHHYNHIRAVNANGKCTKLSIEVIDEVIRVNVNNLNSGDTCTKKVLVHSE